MADDQQKPKQSQTEQEFAKLATDMAKLVGKFMWDMTRLAGRGIFQAYRAIARRRSQEVRDGLTAERKGNNAIGDMMDTVRKRVSAGNAAEAEAEKIESAPAVTSEMKTEAQEIPVAVEESYVEEVTGSDPEAMSLLDDLLKETAADLKKQGITPDAPLDLSESVEVEESTSESDAAVSVPVQTDEAGFDLPPQKEITYKTEEEQAKIEEQLRQREQLLEKEAELRKTTFDEKAAKKAEIQAKVEADRARIREEQRLKREAFEKAEAERKQRQQEREEAALRRARLSDAEPTVDDTVAPDPDQQSATDDN